MPKSIVPFPANIFAADRPRLEAYAAECGVSAKTFMAHSNRHGMEKARAVFLGQPQMEEAS